MNISLTTIGWGSHYVYWKTSFNSIDELIRCQEIQYEIRNTDYAGKLLLVISKLTNQYKTLTFIFIHTNVE